MDEEWLDEEWLDEKWLARSLTVPVTIYLAEVNPTLKVLHYATLDLKKEGEEKTAVRFTLNSQGQVENINTLQTSLIGDR